MTDYEIREERLKVVSETSKLTKKYLTNAFDNVILTTYQQVMENDSFDNIRKNAEFSATYYNMNLFRDALEPMGQQIIRCFNIIQERDYEIEALKRELIQEKNKNNK